MIVQFDSQCDIRDEEKGFGSKIVDEIIASVTKQALTYCKLREKFYKKKYGVEINVNYDVFRSCQAINDALVDLMRLKEFHPVQYPNKLKCASYLAYWWLRRQPITFSVKEKDKKCFLENVSKEDLSKFINCNELWLVSFVFGEIFKDSETECASKKFKDRWEIEYNYLFYYFSYRVESPKAIESLLSTALLHPIWDIQEGVYIEK